MRLYGWPADVPETVKEKGSGVGLGGACTCRKASIFDQNGSAVGLRPHLCIFSPRR